MIDWYVIEFLYPESFKCFANKLFPNIGLISVSSLSYFDNKRLYSFFDDEGVFLNVEMYSFDRWGFTISFKNGCVIAPSHETKQNREEIEIDGFTECFKLLDKKIRERKVK